MPQIHGSSERLFELKRSGGHLSSFTSSLRLIPGKDRPQNGAGISALSQTVNLHSALRKHSVGKLSKVTAFPWEWFAKICGFLCLSARAHGAHTFALRLTRNARMGLRVGTKALNPRTKLGKKLVGSCRDGILMLRSVSFKTNIGSSSVCLDRCCLANHRKGHLRH